MPDDQITFNSDEERQGYLRGVEETARQMAKGPKLTKADVRKMTPQEIAERLPEVRAALKADAQGDADDQD
jgi:hypothetical protein